MTEYNFNAPPGWDVPAGWRPPEGFTPPGDWPAPPEGWQWWLPANSPGRQTEVATAQPDAPSDPNALWEAKGQPIKGFGGGKYKLTPQYLFFEKGTLSTNAQQVPISALMDVDVTQTMTQKARKVGNIRIHIQRPTGIEIVNIEDIPNFREGQEIINRVAHQARMAVLRQNNTMHYTSQAMPGPVQQQPAAVATPEAGLPAAPDPMDQLRKLGELRDAGILTTEEFDAKKAEILGRL